MGVSRAELSSLSSALRELTARVKDLAERAAADETGDASAELFAAERALTGATRRIERLVASLDRGR